MIGFVTWPSVCVQIFEGCKFHCLRGQIVIHEIFFLEISLAELFGFR